jgi:hypothetical protein
MESTVKIALGKTACMGIKAHLGPDVPAAVEVALSNYTRRLASTSPPLGTPPRWSEGPRSRPEVAFDLPVDEKTRATLEREAARQGTTVSQLAAHSVLLYLAELDRMTPLSLV